MPKRDPTNLPAVGDHCRLRGREATGVLREINDLSWARVVWDIGAAGPMIVHHFELEKIE